MFSDVSRDCNTIHFKQQNKSVTIFKAINFTVLKIIFYEFMYQWWNYYTKNFFNPLVSAESKF